MGTATREKREAPGLDVEYATTLLAERGLEIGGRHFVVTAHPTYRQKAYVNKWRRAAGVDDMLNGFDPVKDDKVSEFVEELIVRSFENDAVFHLLAGGLVPVVNGEPAKWDFKTAESLARFFGDLDDERDHDALNKAILGVLSSFFLLRIVSAAASRNSSEQPASAELEERDPSTQESPADRTSANRPDNTGDEASARSLQEIAEIPSAMAPATSSASPTSARRAARGDGSASSTS